MFNCYLETHAFTALLKTPLKRRLTRAVVLVGRIVAAQQLRSARLRRLVLHARLGRVQVEPAVLDVLVDLLGGVEEGVLDVLAAVGD